MLKAAIVAIARRNAVLKRPLDAGPLAILFGLALVLAFLVAKLFRGALTSDLVDLFGVEQNVVLAVERLALTGQLYTDPHSPPFVVLQYGPLFPYAAWVVHRALHLGNDVASFYLATRLTACLSLVALIVGVGAILIRFLRVRPLLAVVASLLAGLVMFPSGYAARPDSTYCALGIWALFAFYRFLPTQSVPWLLASTVLLICAFYAKQTAAAFLPLLGVAGLLCLRTTTQRLIFPLGAAAMAAISAILAPPHFWQNSAAGLANGVDIRWAIDATYWPLLSGHGIVLAAWLPCLLVVLFGRKRWLFPIAFLSAYALAVGTALGVKYGSSINYYDEYLILAIMLIAASLPVVASAWAGQRIAALYFGSALLCSYAMILVRTQVTPILWAHTSRIDDRDFAAIQRYFVARPSSGLVADLGAGIAAFLPSRVAFAPFEVIGSAAGTGHFDLTPVREAIRDGTICDALTPRAWATDVGGPDYENEKRFPETSGRWAAPVLDDLLPRFKPQAEFDQYVLMHNPVCPAS